MRSRATARLLAALVFALSAFGAAGPGTFTVPVAAKTAVSARQPARRAQHLLPEHSECTAPARAERTTACVTDVPRRTVWLPESIFQRPPPSSPPVRA